MGGGKKESQTDGTQEVIGQLLTESDRKNAARDLAKHWLRKNHAHLIRFIDAAECVIGPVKDSEIYDVFIKVHVPTANQRFRFEVNVRTKVVTLK